jgi:hypothetical protein
MRARQLAVMVTALAAALIPLSVKSQDREKDDVQSLYRQCKHPTTQIEQAFCVGFVSGVGQQMMWTGAWLDRISNDDDRTTVLFYSACSETFVSNGAMVQAFINWAEIHPKEWNTSKQLGLIQAIRATWPCPLSKQK